MTATANGEDVASAASLPGGERILLATIEALAEMDPAALTIQHICKRAGATAPTLYYHFGSKDGLIAAAVERLVSDWLALLDATVARDGDLDLTLDQAVAGWRAMIQAPTSPVIVFVWVTLLAARTSEESRDALIRARDRSQEMLREAVAAYFGDTEFAADLAANMVATIISAALQFHLDEDDAGLTQRLTGLVRVVRVIAAVPPA